MGVIDILTPYNAVKKIEHFWKSLTLDKLQISAVHPTWYGKRFMEFMKTKVIIPEPPSDSLLKQKETELAPAASPEQEVPSKEK